MNTKKVIDRIDKLNPNRKILDKETLILYNNAKNESIDVINTIRLKGETSSRDKFKEVFKLIRESFNGKDSKDMPRLETEEKAEERTLSKSEKERVKKTTKESQNKLLID